MRKFFTFVVTVSLISASAQDTCNCPDILNKTIDKVAKNYAGFNDKVKFQNVQRYNIFTDSLQKAAPQNNRDSNCFKLLKAYTSYFKDGHLGITFHKKRVVTHANMVPEQPAVDRDIPSLIIKANSLAIITVSSFSIDYNDTIHKLFDKHKLQLEKCDRWIIDVRGNDGGSQDVYSVMLPYLFTNPIIVEGAQYWCSVDNVKAAREEYEDYKNRVDSLTKYGWEKSVEKREANTGHWLPVSGDTIVFSNIKTQPKKVAILIDKGCASSTEIFLMKARQSKKVILLGTNTNGTVDYGDVLYWDDLPYKPFNLRIATSRWNWIDKTGPIDGTGIKPDILIPTGTNNWIAYTLLHFK